MLLQVFFSYFPSFYAEKSIYLLKFHFLLISVKFTKCSRIILLLFNLCCYNNCELKKIFNNLNNYRNQTEKGEKLWELNYLL